MLDLPQNHADAHRLFMVHPENEYEIMKEKTIDQVEWL
jgi:hypothetical protein